MEPEIIIGGIAGRYPESDNLDEFWKNLIEGFDMVSEDSRRWNIDAYDMPRRMGKLRHLDKFDAEFFGIHGKPVSVMDPKLRIAMEITQEALLDAGINPSQVRGSKTAVFAGAVAYEANAIWQRSSENPSGYTILGNGVCMLANRLTFSFDFRGPSYGVDSGCSSSLVALQNAFFSIKAGLCGAAIVAGVQVSVDPRTTLGFHKLEAISMEGKCRAFDAAASGYVRAEAGVVLYVCRKDKAKRLYATIVGAKCNTDGYKQGGISSPSGAVQEQLAREVYEETGVSPLDVGYVETHGTGTKAGDPQELNAIANLFCEGREGPLLVGSVKTNMGHSEYASGLCGISKLLLAHHYGILPANLHFETPNPDIPSLLDGRVRVVTENTVFNERYVGINSFGFGGTNAHVLLKLTPKAEVVHWDPTFPLLLPVSGRTPEAVEFILQNLRAHRSHRNVVALVHEIFKAEIPRYRCRGYCLLGTDKHEMHVLEQPHPAKRPLWFVFTGLGSQWTGMTRDLMKFKIFQQSISKSDEILQKHNFNLVEFLNSDAPEAINDFKNCIVSITAIQVALADLLATVGVEPQGIVGHSTGEVASAYADGSFSQEQAILVSLGRARAFLESDLTPGIVAAVGLSWEEATSRCPEGVFPAIHNSKNNVTIAGPPEPVRNFVEQLKSEGILAKEVPSAVCAFHSPHVKNSENLMRKLLGEVIPEPKTRSSKWLSSSVPADKWDSELAKYSSVDYHVNNALSPVYFYETLQHVPVDAIVLEIGPHCFMQTTLKQALPETVAKIGLVSKHTDDNVFYFLNALGKLHLEGGNIDVSNLYDPVEFPVGPETPMISPWIKWDHSQTWDVPNTRNEISNSGGSTYTIDIASEADSFYRGHTIDGRVIYPGAGYIFLVWKAFALAKGTSFEVLPVVLEQLRFEQSTLLSSQKPTKLVISFLADGDFNVTEAGMIVFRGRVQTPGTSGSIEDEMFEGSSPDPDPSKPFLTKEDCYKELRLRGYEYSGIFQGISSFCMDGDQAQLEWQDNWISFLDSMLQTAILQRSQRRLYVPIRIEKVSIDPQRFKFCVGTRLALIPLTISKTLETFQCPGIEVRGIRVAPASRTLINRDIQTITEHKFLPYFDEEIYSFEAAVDFCVGIAIDNIQGKKFIFAEHFTQPEWQTISVSISSQCVLRFECAECRIAFDKELKTNPALDLPTISKLMTTADLKTLEPCHLIYVDSKRALEDLKDAIVPKGFILLKHTSSTHSLEIPGFVPVALKHTENYKLALYRRISNVAPIACYIKVGCKDYSWVNTLKCQLASDSKDRIVLFSQSTTGLLGLVKSLIQEGRGGIIRALSIESGELEIEFDNKDPLSSQLQYDLIFNVYRDGAWGCYGDFVIPIQELKAPHKASESYADIMTTGDLSSLTWIESPLQLTGTGKKLCKVAAAALNFKDVMLATGKLSREVLPDTLRFEECVLGLEYSGVYCNKRVMGSLLSKCLATVVVPDPSSMWEIPESWSFEDAATVPIAYSTAMYALIVKGNLKPRESVLIHGGSGGVGQAAITVALDMGCKVYTTVGTKEKREFLKSRFPQLLDANISDSRNSRIFEKHIKEVTEGRGVDVVLNSLAQDKFHASIRCLAKYGRFLEIGRFDMSGDTAVGMSVLLKCVSIHGISLDEIMEGNTEDNKNVFSLIQEGINSGIIQPLPFTSFSPDQLEDAFRYMAGGKHMGKVLIKLGSEVIPSLPRTYFYPHKSHVLIGGLGGMGLEIANWMVERGSRNIVFNSRSGVKSSYQQSRIRAFRGQGVAVVVDRSDASRQEGAVAVLKTAAKLGPIGGIFNMAVVLQDSLFENQTPILFETSSKAKVLTTWELDRASRILAPELDHFVVFSSLVAARGNPGQTNYGFSNSCMERICEQRRQEGLPGLAIQWGLIDDVGVAFENIGVIEQSMKRVGLASQRMASWISTLDLFLRQQTRTILGSFVQHSDPDKQTEIAANSLSSRVAHILGIKNISKINPNPTLFELGLDSFMAKKINQVLSTEVGDISLFARTPGLLTFAQIMKLEEDGVSRETKIDGLCSLSA